MEWVNAIELVNIERLDIVIKYIYVKAREERKNELYAKQLYESHIDAFSDGTFCEPFSDKNTFEKYLYCFNELIDNIKEAGKINHEISCIPVGYNNVLCNGAHRVAIGLYYGYAIPIERKETEGIHFNLDLMKRQRMPWKEINYTMAQYARLVSDCYICSVGNNKHISRTEPLSKIYDYKISVINYNKIVLFEATSEAAKLENGRYSVYSCNSERGEMLVRVLEEQDSFWVKKEIREWLRKFDRKFHKNKIWFHEHFPNLYKKIMIKRNRK